MKRILKYTYILALIILCDSCSGEEPISSESVLDTEKPVLSELDIWIRENFVTPYNIDILYKWDDNQVELNKYLYPPTLENVRPLLDVVLEVWMEPYNEIAGEDFIKNIAPRQLILVGGYNVNESGTITLGFAEQGLKIALFNVDQLDLSDLEDTQQYFHTIQHEYCHILNQTKPYDPSYAKITPSGYTSQWFGNGSSYSLRTALKKGYISRYARANDFEDFAEMVSAMLIMSREEFDNQVNLLVNAINGQLEELEEDADNDASVQSDINDLNIELEEAKKGVAFLRQKEAFVVDYFKSEWDIDIYELQRKTTTAMKDIVTNHKNAEK